MSISAIIVNYNSGAMVYKAVESLLLSRHVSEIIVVDNNSADGSMDAVESLAESSERVHCIRNTENTGFARACNRGLGEASGQYLLFLNPDCTMEPEAVGGLLQCLESDSAIGLVGPLLLNPDGSEQAGGRRAVPTPWRSFVRVSGLHRLRNRYPRLFSDFMMHLESLPQEPVEVEALSGACMLARREAVDDVGLLDEGYFLHCEDLDWCMRFRRKGWRIVFEPHAGVVHYQGWCSRNRPVFVEWHKHRGMIRFYGKFFRHQYPGLLFWAVGAGVWFRFAMVALYRFGQGKKG